MRYQFLRFPGGKGKAVTFSYDDGVRQDLKFSDVLEKYKIKATFNLNSENLRGSNGLTKDEIQEYILNRGHEIAVHGSYHRAEGTLRPIEGIQDVLNCRLELEERFGLIIRGMAYPDTGIAYFTNGAKYENIKNYLKELDIVKFESVEFKQYERVARLLEPYISIVTDKFAAYMSSKGSMRIPEELFTEKFFIDKSEDE